MQALRPLHWVGPRDHVAGGQQCDSETEKREQQPSADQHPRHRRVVPRPQPDCAQEPKVEKLIGRNEARRRIGIWDDQGVAVRRPACGQRSERRELLSHGLEAGGKGATVAGR
jgi:hypothetical protein